MESTHWKHCIRQQIQYIIKHVDLKHHQNDITQSRAIGLLTPIFERQREREKWSIAGKGSNFTELFFYHAYTPRKKKKFKETVDPNMRILSLFAVTLYF